MQGDRVVGTNNYGRRVVRRWGNAIGSRRVGTSGSSQIEARFAEFTDAWGELSPAIIRLWRSSWEQFTPSLAFPPEVRTIIYTPKAAESLNARFRRATRRRGHFPNEPAARKVLYLVIRIPQKNRANITGHTHSWKAALNILTTFYGESIDLN